MVCATHRGSRWRMGENVTIQPIRLFGDPVLRSPADPVVDFDKELRTLVANLIADLSYSLIDPRIRVSRRGRR